MSNQPQQKGNRPIPCYKNPHSQNETKCTTFQVKMSYICTREDKAQRMNPPYRPYTHRNRSKDIFRSSLRSVVPKRVE